MGLSVAWRLLAVVTGLVAVLAASAAAQPSRGPAAPPDPLIAAIRSPEPAFTEALAALKELPRLRSLLVSWRGSLVLERYYGGATAARPANVKSAAKSVMSALVGIAIDRGLLPGVRQPIGGYFPDLLARDADRAKRAITIEDLLTMRSGLEPTSNRNYGAWVQSGNWVRYVLTRKLLAPPGTEMDYSTGNTHLLSAIVTRVAQTSTWQFADRQLARPLGFSLARWPQDPQGIYFGGNDMLMTPRQMVAFGELYLRRGMAGTQRVLSDDWVRTSIVPRSTSYWSGQSYGYGWWIRPVGGYESYHAWGFGGQFIFVVPALDLVVVTTSSPTVSDDRRTHRRTVDDIVDRLIVPAVAAAHGAPPAP